MQINSVEDFLFESLIPKPQKINKELTENQIELYSLVIEYISKFIAGVINGDIDWKRRQEYLLPKLPPIPLEAFSLVKTRVDLPQLYEWFRRDDVLVDELTTINYIKANSPLYNNKY